MLRLGISIKPNGINRPSNDAAKLRVLAALVEAGEGNYGISIANLARKAQWGIQDTLAFIDELQGEGTVCKSDLGSLAHYVLVPGVYVAASAEVMPQPGT